MTTRVEKRAAANAALLFETDNGDFACADRTGIDLADDDEARREVVRVLHDMSGDLVGVSVTARVLSASAHDRTGALVYAATMTFAGSYDRASAIRPSPR